MGPAGRAGSLVWSARGGAATRQFRSFEGVATIVLPLGVLWTHELCYRGGLIMSAKKYGRIVQK